jgi:predicted GIY-YIG superfamily endonuclease
VAGGVGGWYSTLPPFAYVKSIHRGPNRFQAKANQPPGPGPRNRMFSTAAARSHVVRAEYTVDNTKKTGHAIRVYVLRSHTVAVRCALRMDVRRRVQHHAGRMHEAGTTTQGVDRAGTHSSEGGDAATRPRVPHPAACYCQPEKEAKYKGAPLCPDTSFS